MSRIPTPATIADAPEKSQPLLQAVNNQLGVVPNLFRLVSINPHDVATAIEKLIDTPKGQRPDRVIVGQPFGADTLNAQTAPVQRLVVEGLGLGALAAAPAGSVG